MKRNHLAYLLLFLLAASLCGLACKREVAIQPMEATKTLNGSWQVIKATRNGTDLTSRFDFSKFKIVFTDSSYTLENLVPFPVTENGSFYLDDPKYPFKIFLKQTGGQYQPLDMQFPITGGVRRIIIDFSPGCSENTYEYTLQQVKL